MAQPAETTLDQAFARYRTALVRALVRIVGSVSTAEDLVHEAYLRVAAATRARSVEHPAPFLFQTARNLALDHLRAERRRAKIIPLDLSVEEVREVPAPIPSPETQAGDRRLLARFEASLGRLSARQRQVLMLSRVRGWTYDEVAAHLGVSTSTVQKDLKAAMAACVLDFVRHRTW